MTSPGAPAGWYPDPDGSGGTRYFDGSAWTGYRSPPAWYPSWGTGAPYGPPPWKGAALGRPASGPGSLASPWRRLGARVVDGLVLGVAFAILATIVVLIVAPHAGKMFPNSNDYPNGQTQTPGFLWIYLAVIVAGLLTGLVMIAYEGVATARYGRTLGKAWLHIRSVRIDGSPIGWGRSFARIALYWASGFLSYVGLLDPLWCLWDANSQCLHDKAVGTIVVND